MKFVVNHANHNNREVYIKDFKSIQDLLDFKDECGCDVLIQENTWYKYKPERIKARFRVDEWSDNYEKMLENGFVKKFDEERECFYIDTLTGEEAKDISEVELGLLIYDGYLE